MSKPKSAPKPASAKKHAAPVGLSHAEVMDFVTGGASHWAGRKHADAAHTPAPVKSRPKARAATPKPRAASKVRVGVGKDLHSRLATAAAEKGLSVDEALDKLLRRHLK